MKAKKKKLTNVEFSIDKDGLFICENGYNKKMNLDRHNFLFLTNRERKALLNFLRENDE